MSTNTPAGSPGFFKRKNIEFTLHRYGIEALGAMALGLFASLLIGTIINMVGDVTGIAWLNEVGKLCMAMMGPAIAVAVAFGLKAPPFVLFSATVVGHAAVLAGGGPAGCFIAAVIAAECGKMVSKETKIDLIVTPAVTVFVGIAVGQFIGPYIGMFMTWVGQLIMWATELQPIPMGILVSVIMGLALTAPISSAAIGVMLGLSGLAAGAATVGCCCQMVGFAVASYKENKFGGLLAQGIGTSMLQVPNIVKTPMILIPPTLAAAILGPVATTVARMENTPIGSGMGTSGFVGQIGTITVMGSSGGVLTWILVLQILLPAVLTWVIAEYMRKKNWIKFGDQKLDI
ncbi:MAG: PTS sugar transporter subunit IIC [Planctomycetaceae bacterium]|nr:PTS sugar transporter subunit IIC [Planctomycetaceae bacterium]